MTYRHASESDIDRARLDEIAAAFAAEHRCPTLAWGVIHDGGLTLSGAVGPVDEHTVYRIASMTKAFSAAAVLSLRDDGLLALDEPIVLAAPELVAVRSPTSDAPDITIRHLLTMTSGLATDDTWADRHLDLTDGEFDEIVDRGVVFAVPTDTVHEYSNFGFAVLGRVVHRLTGRTIQQHITERLLDPLGLSETTWVQPDHDRWARPQRTLDGNYVDEAPPLGDGLIAPMGGLWTTVSDLSRWVAWLDDAFPSRTGPDDPILRRSSRREMQTPQRYVGHRAVRGVRAPQSYGFGVRISDEPALGTVITHSGGLPGYGSNMRWLGGGRRIGAVAMANTTYAPAAELTALLLDELDSQGAVPAKAPVVDLGRGDLERAARELVALVNDWDDDDADRLFADNVALDDSYAWHRSEIAKVVDGRLTIDEIEIVNGSDATVHAVDGAGRQVEVSFLLAPFRPPRIQNFEVERPEG